MLQRIFNRVAGNLRGMEDVFKELKVLGRKVALHKINNKCIGNNSYKYKHDFSHLLELVLESRLEPVREPRFRRSPSFYGLLVFPHT